MLTVDQNKRINVSDALKHSWILVCYHIVFVLLLFKFSLQPISTPPVLVMATSNKKKLCSCLLLWNPLKFSLKLRNIKSSSKEPLPFMTGTTFGNFLVIQKVTLKNSFSSSHFNDIHRYTSIISVMPWQTPWIIKILKSFVARKRV